MMISFKDTLNLPRTDFPIRPQAKIDDPAMLARWEADKLYEKAFVHNKDAQKYILHDGPPYSNGRIHLGHAYNKILKDIMTKSYRMAGFHVPVTPGWDCHGLPIELKVTQENPGLTPFELKKACRAYAQGWIDVQRAEFKKLGVVMDWDNPYITMAPHYEALTVRAFGILIKKGFIERKNKSVAWCASCATTLASAEIEYKDRKDPSLYVLFQLQQDDVKRLFPEVGDNAVSLLIWTTTPWTLPLNRGVMVHPAGMYQLVDYEGTLCIVGAQVADALAEKFQKTKRVIREFTAQEFTGLRVQHPFIEQLTVPCVFDDSVGLADGTAFVHTAPGCGPIDYEVGVKNKLEVYSPITPQGAYSEEIVPSELKGMPVTDGQIWVIKKLAELGRLFYKTSLTHSYPHCWRCRNGLIFRATPQWFFDLSHESVKEKAIAAVDTIAFIPEQGRASLKATLQQRWEWCLSRQRSWGSPIPALLCATCDASYTSVDLVNKVADGIEVHGIEYWDMVELSAIIPAGFACASCKGTSWKKEHDILDVWFDSGVSHYAVLYNNPALGYPADLYLEGLDQYRGWFQSSWLMSMVLEEAPCMKTIMAHGYTVDAKGQKMSKSLGNVVAPQEIVDQLGTDGLRLWVASIGNASDVVVSETLLRNVSEVYRKIRNTSRFLLQNLYDYDHTKDAVALKDLTPIDQYALTQLALVNSDLIKRYHAGDFTAVFHELADYCASELSAFYLDIIKDRLYVEKADGHLRRSAQTVVWHILDTLTRLMAPILSFTAEQLSDFYQRDKTVSIHLQDFATVPLLETNDMQVSMTNETWDMLKNIRSAVLKSIEPEREQGRIKHSLEAAITVYCAPTMKLYELIKKFDAPFFKEFFIVSQVHLADSAEGLAETAVPGLFVKTEVAQGTKCPRCWNWEITQNADGFCARCQAIIV